MGIMETGHDRVLPLLDPVHYAEPLEADAWKDELERVIPSLKIVLDVPGRDSEWRSVICMAKRLCEDIENHNWLLTIASGGEICSKKWRDELSRLRSQEELLQSKFTQEIASLTELRTACETERDNLTALRHSIEGLCEKLASNVQELEQVRSDTAVQSDTLQDPDQNVGRLRKSLQRLQDEDRQLNVRIKCLQRETLSRSLREAAERPDEDTPNS